MLVLRAAIERLGLSPETVRTQVRNGVLKARRLANQYVETERKVEQQRREHLGPVRQRATRQSSRSSTKSGKQT